MNFAEYRRAFQPKCPQILEQVESLQFVQEKELSCDPNIEPLFPHTARQSLLVAKKGGEKLSRVLQIGVVFSGGQAPGGHNVITGLFDTVKKMHPQSKLHGFLGGPDGILQSRSLDLTKEVLASYRNEGGFDLIGSGRTKLESEEHMKRSLKTCQSLGLDGLVIIGGDDSNTNAALLAEYFLANHQATTVVGVPKTIDGDLQSENIPISFGFDTATKVYGELIGNITKDALSAKKYYHFIRLMGRSASHVTLECALKTHPNLTLLSEECLADNTSLLRVVDEIATLIERRETLDRLYGVILIPEGLLEFLPEMKRLIETINELISEGTKEEKIPQKLSGEESKVFSQLPPSIQKQLLLDRDPHGNVQVSQIETEKLLIAMVKKRLEERKKFHGTFRAVPHFFGYEGRSGYPSNFDANYCYSLGSIAAFLVREKKSGYMAACGALHESPGTWEPKAVPITSLMQLEKRKGKKVPVIKKSLVSFSSEAYRTFVARKDAWKWDDDYQMPGPIQLFGPEELADAPPLSLRKSS
ncbi:MAG: diphosphate--fructose-6-phosphate 1-phosphotransferase [Chlamydiota bacterium]